MWRGGVSAVYRLPALSYACASPCFRDLVLQEAISRQRPASVVSSTCRSGLQARACRSSRSNRKVRQARAANWLPWPSLAMLSGKQSDPCALIDGRDFLPTDTSPGAALVNEAFVRAYFNGENPLGRPFGEDFRLLPISDRRHRCRRALPRYVRDHHSNGLCSFSCH